MEQKADLIELLKRDYVVLFMRGSSSFPVDGFSSTICFILKKCGFKFSTVDLLSNPVLHAYLRERHAPVSAPYLYVGGKFVGGYDAVLDLYDSGKLQAFFEHYGATH